jgi:hypothetical protein
MQARKFRTLLTRQLSYTVVRSTGSHKTLKADGRPNVTFAFKDSQELAPNQVWKVLIRDVGLTEDEAEAVLKRG